MNERMKQPTVCAHTPASKDGLQGTPTAAAADSGAVEQCECEWGTACCSSHFSRSCCRCSQGQVGPGGKKADQLSALCPLLSAHHPTTHGPTDHKHMCVNSKYEYSNNNNNKYNNNNNNNNEWLAWR